jgi:hypothetical protein
MALRRGSALLSLLFVAATVPGAVACSKKTSDASDGAAGDAAAEAAAGNDDAAVGTAAAGAAGSAASGSAVSPAAVSPAAVSPAEPPLPRPTPFTGSYRCFKGLQLLQVGNIVTSTSHKDATTDTVIACTAIGETCTGTTRDIQVVRGKPPKVLHVRPITLVRTHGGDILFKTNPTDKSDTPEKGSARRTASPAKPATGDETFCPRR